MGKAGFVAGALVAAVAALGFFGKCPLDFSGSWKPDEERCGMRIEWGAQADRDVCPYAYAYPIGAKGARVIFTDDVAAACFIFNVPIAGCYSLDFDTIYLKPAATLAQTALAHELTHRELVKQGLPVDYKHAGEIWKEDRLHADGE